jgi:hypothetical protein
VPLAKPRVALSARTPRSFLAAGYPLQSLTRNASIGIGLNRPINLPNTLPSLITQRTLALRVTNAPPELVTRIAALFRGAQSHRLATFGASRTFGGGYHRHSLFLVPCGKPCHRESLPVSAALNDPLLQACDQAIQQKIRLMDRPDQTIRALRWIIMIQPERVILVHQRLGVRPLEHHSHRHCLRIILAPLPKSLLAQVVLVVRQEFILPGTRRIHCRLPRGSVDHCAPHRSTDSTAYGCE